jgi:peptidyl-prolyl cis-trans isomerase C
MKRTRLLFATAFAALILSAPAFAQESAKVLAKVDGKDITAEDVRIATELFAADLPPVGDPNRERRAIDFLVDLIVLSSAAEAAKIQDQPDFAKRLEIARQRTLMERLLITDAAQRNDDATLKASYDEYVNAQKPQEEVRARHILLKEEEAAKKALERVKGGEDFAKVATELSADPGSGKEGGDLGFFTKDRMVPEFGEAAFALQPGQISEIVKSQFGFHIIKLEERRNVAPPPFEQVKEQWKQYANRRSQQELVLKLRAAAKIERMDAPPAAPAEAPKQ